MRVTKGHRFLILVGLVLLAMLLVAPPAWGDGGYPERRPGGDRARRSGRR